MSGALSARGALPVQAREPRVSRRPGLARRIGQAVAVLVGWVGFIGMWIDVAHQPWDVRALVGLIAGSLLVLPLLTWWWVRHNRSIYRRKGPRRAVAQVEAHYVRDWNGRTIEADWPALRHARSITIGVADDVKRYHLGGAPPRPPRRDVS